MKTNIKYIRSFIIVLLFILSSCSQEDYKLGGLTSPTNVAIDAEIVGKSATNPNGDGSGTVNFTISGVGVIGYKIDYGTTAVLKNPADLTELKLVTVIGGVSTKKFDAPRGQSGVYKFRITLVAYGKGGTLVNVIKDISLRTDFVVPAPIIASLTNGTSKTWVVDKSVPGHFGVGPWNGFNIWWNAAVDEKVQNGNCLYTASYKFTKLANGTLTVQITTPDGVFANGSWTKLPISGSDETCYPYAGATRALTFGTSVSGIPMPPDSSNGLSSTTVEMTVDGNDGFIGYGSCSNTYEILSITDTAIYLRSRGIQDTNAWYLKLKPAQ